MDIKEILMELVLIVIGVLIADWISKKYMA